MPERLIQDGFWFLLLTVILAFFWFHHRRRRRANWSDDETMKNHQKVKSTRDNKTA